MAQPDVRSFFDKNTSTWTYLVTCVETKECALIDTVLDFDMQSASTTTASADALAAIIRAEHLTLKYILETHVHADHLTASAYLKQQFGGRPLVGIGERIKEVLAHWVPIFNMNGDGDSVPLDGSQFDVLFKDGDTFAIGKHIFSVLHTPGHTPACVSYVCGKIAFVGDTIFMPAIGTARTDFPGGSAETMYDSCRKMLGKLAEDAVLHVGHDYPSGGDAPAHAATVREHLDSNSMMNTRVTKDEFVEANKEELPVPRLLLPALQVNLRAGHLGPKKGSAGTQYLMIPLNLFNKKPVNL